MSNAIKFTKEGEIIIEIEQAAPTDLQAHLREGHRYRHWL